MSVYKKHYFILILIMSGHLYDKYIFEDIIGHGSFGEVYSMIDKTTNKKIAAKIEDRAKGRLEEEYKVYKKVAKNGNIEGIPQIYKLIQTPKNNIMMMELLGDNLDKLFLETSKKFKLSTILKIGHDATELLEKIHNIGFIHRDIKPNNFMVGCEDRKKTLYIMDFGLSKKYISKGKHHNYKTERSMIGTARYASINIHMGLEPSRRDDLESIGYMLLYFLKGSLPWQGLKKEENIDHLEQIGEVKLCCNIDKICAEYNDCFKKYILYCRKLKFEETPDYKYLKSLFINTANEEKIDLCFEW